MVNRNLIRGLDSNEQDWEKEFAGSAQLGRRRRLGNARRAAPNLGPNQIAKGKVLRVEGDFVLVDVGYKSEGRFRSTSGAKTKNRPKPGQEVNVLIEDVDEKPARRWKKPA